MEISKIIEDTAIEAVAVATKPLIAENLALEDLIDSKNKRLVGWRVVGLSAIGIATILAIVNIAK